MHKLKNWLKHNSKYSKIIVRSVQFIILLFLIKPFITIDFSKQKVNKVLASYQSKFARQIGVSSRQLKMTGKTNVPGTLITLVNPKSKWAVLTDNEGKFNLPDIDWYPGKSYFIRFRFDKEKTAEIETFAPWKYPENGSLDLGTIDLLTLFKKNQREHTYMTVAFDSINQKYYQELYSKVTEGLKTEEEKAIALTKFVSQKRVKKKKPLSKVLTARQLLEPNEPYSYTCGELSNALAHLAFAGDFKVRCIDMILNGNPGETPYTHVVVEIFYNQKWHLYDPNFGVAYRNQNGEIASYQEIRLDDKLLNNSIKIYEMAETSPKWLQDIYAEGVHQKFLVNIRP
jgi:transglutaminase-like putative cysteine protease